MNRVSRMYRNWRQRWLAQPCIAINQDTDGSADFSILRSLSRKTFAEHINNKTLLSPYHLPESYGVLDDNTSFHPDGVIFKFSERASLLLSSYKNACVLIRSTCKIASTVEDALSTGNSSTYRRQKYGQFYCFRLNIHSLVIRLNESPFFKVAG